MTIFWNVSAFNPYGVILMKTTVRPAGACAGDCNGNGQVGTDALLTLVNIGLGNAQPSTCWVGIPDGAEVDSALIIQAVNHALKGCGGG